ncbi:MAG: Rieske (2Fe-2S) protein [Planctomycetota bacterium]|jgi:nitrite reductase/ring-hydroxylating ferredoxin subunit|nr:Rieske (2Fe-2S) protein [Planctomycetota bacterium]MDG2143389.1 Rieske (2Fe-2S) protein [Planctomycetota bacterium]|tara:strand:- start:98 stop:448 length:351 start_codon:yes stop_codon:yes gene_type:complete
MFKKLVSLFGGKPALVTGAGKLEEGQAKVVTFGDVLAGNAIQVMFSRVNGELRAMDAICPHEGVLMNDGPVTDGRIVCPMHLYEFDTQTGREQGAQCKKAKIFKVREIGNDAEVWI